MSSFLEERAFQLSPAGTCAATCVGWIDMGTLRNPFFGQPVKPGQQAAREFMKKLMLVFEVAWVEEGAEPYVLGVVLFAACGWWYCGCSPCAAGARCPAGTTIGGEGGTVDARLVPQPHAAQPVQNAGGQGIATHSPCSRSSGSSIFFIWQVIN
jgi:hypothetical protein